MLAKAAEAGTSLAAYEELQGKNINGTPNPATPPLLDVAAYARYIAINAWGGNWDWPRNNFFAARSTDPATTTGFEFFGWDTENTIGNNLSRSPLNADVFDPTKTPGNDFTGSDNAGQPHTSLKTNPEYQLLFADEVQKMFFNGGILTPEKLVPRYQELADEIQAAMVAESARWGDMHYPTQPLTPADWITERDWILNTYLPQRTAIVLTQLKNYGLYPTVDAPVFNQFGGNYAGGFKLSMTNPNSGGAIYYTVDGSDPRLIGGALNTTAKTYSSAFLLSGNVTVKARYLSTGGVWSALVESPFSQNAVGQFPGDFNRDGGLTPDDLPAMLNALTDVNAYRASKSLTPEQLVAIGDLNGDGAVSNRDIQAMLDRLIAQQSGGGSGGGAGASESDTTMVAIAPLAALSADSPHVLSNSVLTGSNSAATTSGIKFVASQADPLLVGTSELSLPTSLTADSIDQPLLNTSKNDMNDSPAPSKIDHSPLDDFYRELSLTTTRAPSPELTVGAGNEGLGQNSATDGLLAELIDAELL